MEEVIEIRNMHNAIHNLIIPEDKSQIGLLDSILERINNSKSEEEFEDSYQALSNLDYGYTEVNYHDKTEDDIYYEEYHVYNYVVYDIYGW